MITYRRSQGVALVFVIFIVALVAVLATTLLSNQFTQIRRLENSIHLSRLLQQAYGVEAWGIEVLKRDQLTSQTDHLDENWAKPLEPIKLDDTGTQVAGWIHDLSARYDLNNLIDKGKAYLPDINQFRNVVNRLEVEPSVIDAIVDWIDTDTLTQAAGAEDPYYQGLQPAYYAPNRPLSHVSEIAYIKDMNAITLERISHHVTSLPELSTININTASADVLEMSVPGLTLTAAEGLIQHREESPYEDVSSFISDIKNLAGLSDEAIKLINTESLAVNSRFFEVTSAITFNDNVLQMHSRIYRDPNGGLRVYERELQLLQ